MTASSRTVEVTFVCPERGLTATIVRSLGTVYMLQKFPIHLLVYEAYERAKLLFGMKSNDYHVYYEMKKIDFSRSIEEIISNGGTFLLLKENDENVKLNENLSIGLKNCPEFSTAYPVTRKINFEVYINDQRMLAFLDTGAMISIITPNSVSICRLESFVDPRFSHNTTGVGGESTAEGKICGCPVRVAQMTLYISLTVIKGPEILLEEREVLLGMDFIKKYVKSIDFEEGKIHFKTTSSVNAIGWN